MFCILYKNVILLCFIKYTLQIFCIFAVSPFIAINMELINRQSYINEIKKWFGKNLAIILTGQRRVGKSCILRFLSEELAKDNNVIYIDKEQRQFDNIRTYLDLNEYIEAHTVEGKRNYIMIDEVQDIVEFERTLRSFYNENNTEVIATGSNAKMLSSELSTLIGGRYVEIYIQPLSFAEFLTFHNLTESNPDALINYIEYGGMPGLAQIGLNREDAIKYLTSIYETTLLKDVVMKNQIRNVDFLARLVQFIADNEGKLISATNISKYMKSIGVSLSPAVIINYQKMLCDSYLMHKVSRYDIHGRRLFESNEKFYFEDHGVRNAIAGGTRDQDIEKVIENVIYQHLVRLGYTVLVGQLQAGEVDFVCSKPTGEQAYVQASYLIADETTREREFGNLRKINDNYPKYVISMTPLVSRNDNNGIIHLSLQHFLTKGL